MSSWIFMGLISAVVIYAILLFNGLVRARNLVAAAWADIDVQLQRRHDLVPRLVEAVRAYMSHEQETLKSVTAQRDQAVRAQAIDEKSSIETALEGSLQRLVAVAEDYPDLKASDNFRDLADDLVQIEDHLQFARRFYNGAVRDYNIRIERVPDRFLAGPMGFKPSEFFQAEAGSRGPISVGMN